MDEDHQLKLAIISGASSALQYKRSNPRASDEETLRHVTRNVEKILAKVGQDE
jgi:hypothetical protein